MKSLAAAVLTIFLLGVACDNSNSGSTPTTASPPLVSETLSGTVSAPVNGILQSSFNPFTVASPGGSVSVTLTSATETRPDGSSNPNVVVGVAVGTPSGTTTCTLGSGNTPVLLQASANSTLSGTAAAGAYCVQVSDGTNQKGPVAYTIVVMHP